MHEKFCNAPNSFMNSYFDGVFMTVAPNAAKVRNLCLKMGFVFEELRNPKKIDVYYQNPGFSFAEAYLHNKIYYVDTVHAFKDLIQTTHSDTKHLSAGLFKLSGINNQQTLFHESIKASLLKFLASSRKLPSPLFAENKTETHRWVSWHIAVHCMTLAFEKLFTIVEAAEFNQFVCGLGTRNAFHPGEDFVLEACFQKHSFHLIFNTIVRSYIMATVEPHKVELSEKDIVWICGSNKNENELRELAASAFKIYSGTVAHLDFVRVLFAFGIEDHYLKYIENTDVAVACGGILEEAIRLGYLWYEGEILND